MPTEILAYQHGIYPRSEALVEATRDLDRGRTEPDRVDHLFDEERDRLEKAQRAAGLDLISDGLLRWQDLFRPLVDSCAGLEARGLVRWFDNNSFVRAPEVRGDLSLGELPPWFTGDGAGEAKVATLPSPYVFSRILRTDRDRDELMRSLGRDVLSPAARRLVGDGARLVHLEEPWLGYHGIDRSSWRPFEESLAAIRDATGDATLVLHVYYGDAGRHADLLRGLPVDAVGVDFVGTELESLGSRWDTGLVAGCLDGRRSVPEPPEETAAFVVRAAERLQPPALFITSGSDLELLGDEVARRKVEILGEVAGLVRERVG